MAEVLAIAALSAGAALLLVGGLVHLRDGRALLASLLHHDVLPYRVARIAARTTPPLQVLVALAAIAAVATGEPRFTPAVGLAATATFLAMACYLAAAVLRNPDATCNCWGKAQPLTWISVIRALVLAGGAALYSGESVRALDTQELLLGAILGAAFATALAVLPTATHVHRQAQP